MARRYTHLFFDLDHTLWDFEANAAKVLLQLWDAHGAGAPFGPFKERFDHHNERLWAKFRAGVISREDLRWKRFAAVLLDLKRPDEKRARELSAAFLEALPQQTGLIRGAREVLRYCAGRGYAMHLITNGFEATQWQKLRGASIGHCFGHVFTSEACGRPKPHRGIFEFAQKTSGATPEGSLMIGDALAVDIKGAREAGWDQVYFNPAGTPHRERCTYEIRELSQLPKIL